MPSGVPVDCPWTDGTLAAEALRLRDVEGLSSRQIAARLGKGLTRNAIIGKLLRLDTAAGRIKTKRPVKTEQERRLSAKLAKERHRQATKFIRPRNPNPKPPRAVVPRARPVPVVIEHHPQPTPLSLASDNQCRAIDGEPIADALICGGVVKAGSAYCGFHHARFYYSVTEPRKRREPVSSYRLFGVAV